MEAQLTASTSDSSPGWSDDDDFLIPPDAEELEKSDPEKSDDELIDPLDLAYQEQKKHFHHTFRWARKLVPRTQYVSIPKLEQLMNQYHELPDAHKLLSDGDPEDISRLFESEDEDEDDSKEPNRTPEEAQELVQSTWEEFLTPIESKFTPEGLEKMKSMDSLKEIQSLARNWLEVRELLPENLIPIYHRLLWESLKASYYQRKKDQKTEELDHVRLKMVDLLNHPMVTVEHLTRHRRGYQAIQDDLISLMDPQLLRMVWNSPFYQTHREELLLTPYDEHRTVGEDLAINYPNVACELTPSLTKGFWWLHHGLAKTMTILITSLGIQSSPCSLNSPRMVDTQALFHDPERFRLWTDALGLDESILTRSYHMDDQPRHPKRTMHEFLEAVTPRTIQFYPYSSLIRWLYHPFCRSEYIKGYYLTNPSVMYHLLQLKKGTAEELASTMMTYLAGESWTPHAPQIDYSWMKALMCGDRPLNESLVLQIWTAVQQKEPLSPVLLERLETDFPQYSDLYASAREAQLFDLMAFMKGFETGCWCDYLMERPEKLAQVQQEADFPWDEIATYCWVSHPLQSQRIDLELPFQKFLFPATPSPQLKEFLQEKIPMEIEAFSFSLPRAIYLAFSPHWKTEEWADLWKPLMEMIPSALSVLTLERFSRASGAEEQKPFYFQRIQEILAELSPADKEIARYGEFGILEMALLTLDTEILDYLWDDHPDLQSLLLQEINHGGKDPAPRLSLIWDTFKEVGGEMKYLKDGEEESEFSELEEFLLWLEAKTSLQFIQEQLQTEALRSPTLFKYFWGNGILSWTDFPPEKMLELLEIHFQIFQWLTSSTPDFSPSRLPAETLILLINQNQVDLLELGLLGDWFSAEQWGQLHPTNQMNLFHCFLIRNPYLGENHYQKLLHSISEELFLSQRPQDGANLMHLLNKIQEIRGSNDLLQITLQEHRAKCRQLFQLPDQAGRLPWFDMVVEEGTVAEEELIQMCQEDDNLTGQLMKYQSPKGETIFHQAEGMPSSLVQIFIKHPEFEVDLWVHMYQQRVFLTDYHWDLASLTQLMEHPTFRAEHLETCYAQQPNLAHAVLNPAKGISTETQEHLLSSTWMSSRALKQKESFHEPITFIHSPKILTLILDSEHCDEELLHQTDEIGASLLQKLGEDAGDPILFSVLDHPKLTPELFNRPFINPNYFASYNLMTFAVLNNRMELFKKTVTHRFFGNEMINQPLSDLDMIFPLTLIMGQPLDPEMQEEIRRLLHSEKLDWSPSFQKGSGVLNYASPEYYDLILDCPYFTMDLIRECDCYQHHLLHVTPDTMGALKKLTDRKLLHPNDLYTQDFDGDHIMVMVSRNVSDIKQLMEHPWGGPQLYDLVSKSGYNGFTYTVMKRELPSVRLGLQYVNQEQFQLPDFQGRTVVHHATLQKDSQLLEILQESEYLTPEMWRQPDKEGLIPLVPLMKNHPQIFGQVYRVEDSTLVLPSSKTLLMEMVENDTELAEQLVEAVGLREEDLMARDARAWTLLFYSVQTSLEITQAILEHPKVTQRVLIGATSDHTTALDLSAKTGLSMFRQVMESSLCTHVLMLIAMGRWNFLHAACEFQPEVLRYICEMKTNFRRFLTRKTHLITDIHQVPQIPLFLAAKYQPEGLAHLQKSRYWRQQTPLLIPENGAMCLMEICYHYQPIAFQQILRDARFNPEMLRYKVSSDTDYDLYNYFLRHSNVETYSELEELFDQYQVHNLREEDPERACISCGQFQKRVILNCHHLLCVSCALSRPQCAECRADISTRTLMH